MEIQQAIEWQKAFKRTYKGQPKEVDEACDLTITALEEIQQYRAIGTVEECREAREKQTPKKSIRIIVGAHDSTDGCPVCKKTFYEKVNFCSRCGNAIAWSE